MRPLQRASLKRISRATIMVVWVGLGSLICTASASADSAPLIEGESLSAITATNATLEAKINPNGLETSYQVRLASGCVVEHLACDAIECNPFRVGSSLILLKVRASAST
jgi:hypothetical protein